MTEDLGHANIVRAGIKVGYCLTDFSEPMSGFTLFAPGSHLLPTPLPLAQGEIDPPDTVDLRLNAGDAFLFENRIFHTSAPNLQPAAVKSDHFGLQLSLDGRAERKYAPRSARGRNIGAGRRYSQTAFGSTVRWSCRLGPSAGYCTGVVCLDDAGLSDGKQIVGDGYDQF